MKVADAYIMDVISEEHIFGRIHPTDKVVRRTKIPEVWKNIAHRDLPKQSRMVTDYDVATD
jgi:ribosomal protein S26